MILFSNRATEFSLPEPVVVEISWIPGLIAAGVIFVFCLIVVPSFIIKNSTDEKKELIAVTVCIPIIVGLFTTLFVNLGNELESIKGTDLAFRESLTANYGVELPDTGEYIYDYTAAAGDQAGNSFAVLDDGAKYECELFIFDSKTYSVYCGENADKVALETLVN